MQERQKKAFDFTAESTKLLITLSTGMIALTITFPKEFIADLRGAWMVPLGIAWAGYLLSVICGLATMLSITGELSGEGAARDEAGKEVPPSVYARSITSKSLLQILFFLLALGATCVHGSTAIG